MSSPTLRLLRTFVAPALLVVAAATVFARGFAPRDLVEATAVSVVLGGLAGWGVSVRRSVAPSPWGAVAAVAGLVVGIVVGVVVLTGSLNAVAAIRDALSTFLVVGIPAPGLPSLALVVFVVLFPAMAVATWASAAQHTLTTIVSPVLAMAAGAVLVAPVGSPWWAPASLTVVIGGVLVADVRNDLDALPPLVGSATELRHHRGLWRPVAQAIPALVVLAVVVAAVPHPGTFDPRDFVDPDTVRVEDPNPLAVAAGWRESQSAEPTAEVRVEGDSPGRLRVAVLAAYSDIGWEQAADYQVTGDRFAPDPVYPEYASGQTRPAPTSSVTTRRLAAEGFRALPTAGVPAFTGNPKGLRYAPAAGAILSRDAGRAVTYDAVTMATAPPSADEPLVGEFPNELASCPQSEGLRAVADQLTAGTVGAAARLAQIENWLLTRRIYDPSAPGGQTMGSVEQFISQSFARGNLEVFVTTYALLARCAGVPVRVVVGYPAPEPGTTELGRADVTAWVEAPLSESGWVPFDPLPTPAEQELQAQLAQQEPPEVEPADPSDAPVLEEVEPTPLPGSRLAWLLPLLVVVVLGLMAAWAVLVPRSIAVRRRRIANPSLAIDAAWSSTTESLADHGVELAARHTPSEVVRVAAGSVPVSVPALVAGLAPIVDRARYSGAASTQDDADLAWGHVDALEERMPRSSGTRLIALLHPLRMARRLLGTFGVALQGRRRSVELPDTAVVSSANAPDDIPGVGIQSRIGDGSTGTVYRGALLANGEQVAVKVFRFGPGDPGFDGKRFEWEVRIAKEVSGLPHVPVVHDAGIAPLSGRPYIVTLLYEGGTLLDHVRRGGPMTESEATAIGGDLTAALDALHKMGVIHADVKPENVFASPHGWVLGDLGSAWLRSGHGPAASLTPPYAAPEVWRGAAPTHDADMYSLALTMMFARTGQVPVAGNPPSPDDIVAAFGDLPVMLRALDPDPRRRPTNVAELGREIRPGYFSSLTGGAVMTINLPTPTVTTKVD